MKGVFFACLAALVLASLGRFWTLPEAQTDKPILYWNTDNNPARVLQLQTFQEWLEKERAKDPSVPDVIFKTDTANADLTKVIIQGVARVGADLPQVYPAGGQGIYLDRMGLLVDLNPFAAQMGFGPADTFAAIGPQLFTLDGKQICYPSNVTSDALWVNEDTFKKYGMEPPPRRWTVDEFETIGREFVKRANEGKTGAERVFFAASIDTTVFLRSGGVDLFNETCSGAGYDRPEFVEIATRYRKWIHEDRLLPSDADKSSANVQSGYGGLELQLFRMGRAGMFHMGRYALIGLREIPDDEKPMLNVSEVPHFRFPNAPIITRAVGIYAGSHNIEAAKYFLKYMASEEYNLNIIEDADSLPPNPIYTRTEAFLRPPKYPNEHKVHGEFLRIAQEIAIAATHSRFILTTEAQRVTTAGLGAVTAEPPLYTPARAREVVKRDIDNIIAWTLREYPDLVPAYEKARADQEKIDALRATGQKIPASLIVNDFYRQYYKALGQLDEGN